MKVYLGVGHGHRSDGSFDPGAEGDGWTEQSAGDYIVRRTAEDCRRAGFEVKDEAFKRDPNFPGTTRAANAWGADVVVEVHHDWSGAPEGAFGHWLTKEGKKVADNIQEAVGRAGFPLRPSWHKQRTDLYILRHTNAPCVLYEVGKIGQGSLDTPKELEAMGRAIAKGILDWAGVQDTPEDAEEDVVKRLIHVKQRGGTAYELVDNPADPGSYALRPVPNRAAAEALTGRENWSQETVIMSEEDFEKMKVLH